MAFVKSVHDATWNCKIDEGLAGLAHCRWSPDSRHVLSVSDFKLRLTVWSLTDKSVQYIPSPKYESKALDFSPDGKLMALCTKVDQNQDFQAQPGQQDVIGVYSSTGSKWECLHQFAAATFDLEDLKFSRDGQHLIVWDSALRCLLQVYKLNFSGKGEGISSVSVIASFQPYENAALGIRTLEMSANRQYVLAGYFDQKLRLYNSLSWRELFTFDHTLEELTVENSPEILNIYAESDSKDGIYYEAVGRPFKIPVLPLQSQVASKQEFPRRGVSIIQISFDSRFVACKNENAPRVIWIWDLIEMSLNSLLVQQEEVMDLAWCPKTYNLNISTASSRLFLWSPKGASVCQVPLSSQTNSKKVTDLQVKNVIWNPNGSSFAALDKTQLVFVYPQLQFFDQAPLDTERVSEQAQE